MTGERRRRKGCSSNKHKVVEEVEKRNLRKSRVDGVWGAERETGYDWLEEGRSGKKERIVERIDAEREK